MLRSPLHLLSKSFGSQVNRPVVNIEKKNRLIFSQMYQNFPVTAHAAVINLRFPLKITLTAIGRLAFTWPGLNKCFTYGIHLGKSFLHGVQGYFILFVFSKLYN